MFVKSGSLRKRRLQHKFQEDRLQYRKAVLRTVNKGGQNCYQTNTDLKCVMHAEKKLGEIGAKVR
jgi:hypothetical protein